MTKLVTPVAVFWCEPTGTVQRSLRCFQFSDKHPCAKGGYCNASRVLDVVPAEFETNENTRYFKRYDPADWPWDAFPTACERCGAEIPDPHRQIALEEIFVVKTGVHSGKEFPRRDLPVGAMFHQWLYEEFKDWCGWDGRALYVVTPDGEWGVDMQANNCTDRANKKHRCWVRHGDPTTGYLHVDKDGTPDRPTCAAGAGSIWMHQPDGWHGFAHRGFLVDCDLEGDGRAAVDRMLERMRGGFAVAPAERVLSPVRLDLLRVRRTTPSHPVTPVGKAFGRWRSNRRR